MKFIILLIVLSFILGIDLHSCKQPNSKVVVYKNNQQNSKNNSFLSLSDAEEILRELENRYFKLLFYKAKALVY